MEKERKYAVKYHKVRFFERVKLERRLGKLQRQQEKAAAGQGPPWTAEQEAELQQSVEDLHYVLHFPKGEKYISVLKNAEDPEAQAHLDAERSRLRLLVKKQQVEVALMTEADEGRSLAVDNTTIRSVQSGKVGVKQAPTGTKRKADTISKQVGDDDQSDDDIEEEKDDFFLFESENEGASDKDEDSESEDEIEIGIEDEQQQQRREKGGGAIGSQGRGPIGKKAREEESEEEEEEDSELSGSDDGEEEEESSDGNVDSGSDSDGQDEHKQRQGKLKGNQLNREQDVHGAKQYDDQRRIGGFNKIGRGNDRGSGGPGRGGFGSAGRSSGRGRGRGGPSADYKKPFGGVSKPLGKDSGARGGKGPAPSKPAEKLPVRSRAEGGRKRRK